MNRVCVVDYGIGNVQSVLNAVRRTGREALLAHCGEELRAADPQWIVLPGVGAIGAALRNLRERKLDAALAEFVLRRGVPFLGICVGMQVLAEACEEFGEHTGLGWLPGRVRHLSARAGDLRVPHVGWNDLDCAGRDHVLEPLRGQHVYFVHSYFFDCPDEHVTAWADYGARFPAAVRRKNIRAVQFHPEKSSHAGERLIAEFLREERTDPC